MNKIAIFSPLPPVKSGISYYTAILAEALSAFYDITFFVDCNYEPDDAVLSYANVYKVQNINDTVKKLGDFDVVLYHFGNSEYHAYMYDISLIVPGVVVLHDFILHHLVAEMTLRNKKSDMYLSKVAQWYPEYLDKAKYIVKNNLIPDLFHYPFNDEIVNGSLCIIVHNNYAKNALDAKFKKNTFVVPMMSLCPTNILKKEYCKKEYFTISCFGFIAVNKRTHIVLSVFQKLTEKYENIRLNLVGQMAPEMNILLDFVKDNHLEDKVEFTGFCSDDDLNEYLSHSDVCVNLRYPSAGETSATLVMALAHGVPTIVSKYQQFDEYPNDVVLKVPLNQSEKDVLYAYLEKLILDVEFGNSLGDNAREYMKKNQSFDVAVARYKSVIDQIILDRLKGRMTDTLLADVKKILI